MNIGPFGPYVRILARIPREQGRYGTDHVVQVRNKDNTWEDVQTFNDFDDDFALTHATVKAQNVRRKLMEGEKP